MDFIIHLTPAIILVMAAWLAVWKLVFGKRLQVSEQCRDRVMAMDESKLITDPALLKKSGAILGLTILGFVLHGYLHYEPATIALAGAALLLLVSGEDPAEAFKEVEWSTIFFFIGLFIVIGGTVKAGLITLLSQNMIALTAPTADNTLTLAMTMIWFSGFTSAIIDNIPFVATMNPLLVEMAGKIFGGAGAEATRHAQMLPVWWALSLGACLGGNGTAIGASANVIVLGIARKAGHPISFLRFFKYGAPVTLLTLLVSSLYIYVRYYAFR